MSGVKPCGPSLIMQLDIPWQPDARAAAPCLCVLVVVVGHLSAALQNCTTSAPEWKCSATQASGVDPWEEACVWAAWRCREPLGVRGRAWFVGCCCRRRCWPVFVLLWKPHCRCSACRLCPVLRLLCGLLLWVQQVLRTTSHCVGNACCCSAVDERV